MHDMCSRDILIAFAILVVVHPRDFSVVMISIAVIFCLLAFLWWLFVSPPPLG
jgi:UDP-N-acetylmuramyl pentapeptide phosphotransferase/UDP-N-acetylglucosamine-1-phosphate transferase